MNSISKFLCCVCLLTAFGVRATAANEPGEVVSTEQFSGEVQQFLGREIAAHVADIRSLDPAQDRVVGVLATGDFSWGAFMRAVASYSALSGNRTIAGKDAARLIGQIGLIESRKGGKSFAQLYGAMAMLHFGADLKNNAVWQALQPQEQEAWRSLLDPARFYDRKTRHVINLPENYFGVAARVVSMDYQMGFITDRAFVDDILDRAAEQFTSGHLYSDDALPAGRYDRYSNEYARYVYMAAEGAGRTDITKALEPTLKTQMRLWWDLISPDGYGYPWGRSLGAISYIDTLEIVGFLGQHPQFRPAPMPQLASAYYVAWQWLSNDFQRDRHLLNVFGYGRGNYSYINTEREWQQTAAFFGKAAGAHMQFTQAMKREGIATFPAKLSLPEVARFEFFRKGDRPAGVWIVRAPQARFALPIVAGTRPGVSDYLPAPYNLAGFAPPVEQQVPATTPYLQLADGRTIVAGDGADEIVPSPDGLGVRAVWRRWAVLSGKAGELVDPGLTAEVTWKLQGNSIVRKEVLTASRPLAVSRFWVVVPSTATTANTQFEDGIRVDRLNSVDGMLEVLVAQSDIRLQTMLRATGDTKLGKGSRGPVPLLLEIEARDFALEPAKPLTWTLVLRSIPAEGSGADTVRTKAPRESFVSMKTALERHAMIEKEVIFFGHDQVDAAFAKGAVLYDGGPGHSYQVHAARKTEPGMAEVHAQDTDVIYVVEGSGTIVTGGAVVNPKTTGPGETRGASISGGSRRTLSKGDTIIIPNGTPHWIDHVEGTLLYHVVKVRSESAGQTESF